MPEIGCLTHTNHQTGARLKPTEETMNEPKSKAEIEAANYAYETAAILMDATIDNIIERDCTPTLQDLTTYAESVRELKIQT
jgi:hypothetical protein